MFNVREIASLCEQHNPLQIADAVVAEMRKNKAGPVGFSLRNTWRAFVGDPDETLPKTKLAPGGLLGNPMIEEVRAGAFLHVTSEVLINRVQAAYSRRPSRLDALVSPFESNMRVERMVGFSAMDGPEDVDEGEEYGGTEFEDRAVSPPEPKKRGRLIEITDEAIRFDRTGQIITRAQMFGEKMAIDRERAGFKTIQDNSTGVPKDANRYRAFWPYVAGVPTVKDLYHNATSGGAWYESFDNLAASNALVDWSNIQTAWLLFKAAVDEAGDEIAIMPDTLLVPMELLATAASIINAVTVRTGTDQIGGTTLEPLATFTDSANAQINAMGLSNVTIITTPYMDSTTTWYLGDFRSQFVEQVIIPTEVSAIPGDARRDIVAAFRVRRKSRVAAVDDKFVVKSTA